MKPTPQIFKSTCSYCGVGCGIEILRHSDGRLDLRGDESHPANRGMLCSKGRSLLHTVNARGTRLHYPTMRTTRDAARERVPWDAAIGHIAERFRRIIAEHGPDAVAFYVSGQCLTEEYYLANKIAKGFLGTNNIDTNSRLCMSSAVAGYKATLGADAPPVCYEDIECCDTFFIAGANPAWCHPILFRRIEARKAADPCVKVIVVDPRRTASAEIADLHLQIRPGTDVALFLGIARQLIHTDQIDKDFLANHVEGSDAYFQSAAKWTLTRTASACGVAEHDIAQAAAWLGADRRFLSMWTMGLNQSAVGTDKNIALISLSLLTGKIGKPGCGPFSLTGQPNAMGGREVGGMATLLPAHRDLSNPDHRAQVARFWGVDALPQNPGLTAVELFDALAAGKVKAVWIIATNPAASLPSSWQAEKALSCAELVVVQDIYPTETAAYADVLLPAAGWLEKTGTMTNSDRRIALLEKAVDAPGEALPDTEILRRFAHAMGWESAFNYASPAEIFAEHCALTQDTDIDITALSHETLKSQGPTQWPAPASQISNFRSQNENAQSQISNLKSQISNFKFQISRLYTDHRFATPTSRARLHALTYENRSEQLSEQFPLILTTGRVRDHWHTMTKTGQVNRLRTHVDEPFCEIHPADAAHRGIREGDIIAVRGTRGEVRVPAQITQSIRQGVLFLPMHFGKRVAPPSRRCANTDGAPANERTHWLDANATGRTNNLTSPRFDPISKEPDLKFAAVQAERYVPARRRIVIIGAGAAAFSFVEHHRRHNQEDELVILGGEDLPLYNRDQLPHDIEAGGGDESWRPLVRADRETLLPHRVIFHPNTLVSRIDPQSRQVLDSRGRSFAYDVLIIATGSRPAIHYDGSMPDHGIFTLRSRKDADAILAASSLKTQDSRLKPPHAVIHGGGLLGIELADALRARGCDVTILQRSDRLMGKQLDQTASTHLARELALRNITVRFNTTLVELVGADRLTGVRLAGISGQWPVTSGRTPPPDHWPLTTDHLPCDLFIFATGTLPNKELAGAARLDCDKGILVNEHLRTSDPNIFAIGECAQFHDHLAGTTAAAERQAAALAEFLRGREHAPFRPVAQANILKIRDFRLAAAGITDPPPDDLSYETITFHDPRRRIYQKCIIQNDRLVGTICLGESGNFPRCLDLIQNGLELEDLRDTLLRAGASSQPPDGKLICSCNQVGAGTIEKCASACGHDLSRVISTTRAGAGCGSCRPEVAALLARIRPRKPKAAHA
jgi:ferredoxin-nitrate reductase